jgi:hypothetical protein
MSPLRADATDATGASEDASSTPATENVSDSASDVGIARHAGHDDGAMKDAFFSHLLQQGAPQVQQIVDSLKKALADGVDLPGDMTAEDVTSLVDDLSEALKNDAKETIRSLLEKLHAERAEDHFENVLNHLSEELASGELPEGITKDQLQKAVEGLKEALAADDLKSAGEILKGLGEWRHEGQDGGGHAGDGEIRQSLIDRVTSGIKAQVEKLQSMLAAGNLPGGLTQEAVQTALTGVTAALEAQDVEAARKILSDLFQSMADNQQQSLIDRVTSGIKAQVEKLQSMLAAGNLPGGLTQEAVQTALTGVTAALEAQDVEAARKILSDLFRSMAENQQEQTLLERMTAAIKAQLEGIQKAADAGKLPAGVTSEAVSAAIEEATKALESKDIQGARQILANLLKPAVDNDKPAPPAPPVVSLPVAPTPLPIPVPLPNLPVNLPAQVTNVGARIANVAKSFFGR